MKEVIVTEPAAVYQGDDESAILAAAEMLMKGSLSSLTRGYGSILLSTLFLLHILSLSLLLRLSLQLPRCCHSSQLVRDHLPHRQRLLLSFTVPPVRLMCPVHSVWTVLSHTVFSHSQNLHLKETKWPMWL